LGKYETGTIKWVHPNEVKCFGFIRCADGKEMFFRFRDGITFFSKENRVARKSGIERVPKFGDRVIFERRKNYKGEIASPWGYAENYQEASRATDVHLSYRVIEETVFISREHPFRRIIWNGTNLEYLARDHPRTGNEMDDLRPLTYAPHKTIFLFEVENAGQWERMADPRPLVRECVSH
jgi:hypothetical protein